MVTRKDRRHSGYVTPRATIARKDLEKYDLAIEEFYDDWEDYRDGFRDWFRDFKKIKKIRRGRHARYNGELIGKRIKMNRKQKKLQGRRELRKYKQRSIQLHTNE